MQTHLFYTILSCLTTGVTAPLLIGCAFTSFFSIFSHKDASLFLTFQHDRRNIFGFSFISWSPGDSYQQNTKHFSSSFSILIPLSKNRIFFPYFVISHLHFLTFYFWKTKKNLAQKFSTFFLNTKKYSDKIFHSFVSICLFPFISPSSLLLLRVSSLKSFSPPSYFSLPSGSLFIIFSIIVLH